jgi:hypothetical protein
VAGSLGKRLAIRALAGSPAKGITPEVTKTVRTLRVVTPYCL